ncbi:MAG: FAD-dependent oxidoreductase [Cyclobacteriaceae bacterium]|nr:FAD-dependent oxidoreductase [Cyclobacteriaceae bacterium]
MNRRDFLHKSIPLTGAVVIGPGFLSMQSFAEINRQFSGIEKFESYDLIVNGAGLYGYFTAINAAKLGHKVLIIERRTSPGYELAAKKQLWLKKSGFENWSPELIELFMPNQEMQEIHSSKGEGPHKSIFGDELALFSGSIRKNILRSLIVNNIHVLLMTDVCGIFRNDKNHVTGALLASKCGFHSVNCNHFIDASDNHFFTRQLFNQNNKIIKAGFCLELQNVGESPEKLLQVEKKLGIVNDSVILHKGKQTDHQYFLEFEFKTNHELSEISKVEQKARVISAELGKKFNQLDLSLANAKIEQFAMECTYHLENPVLPKSMIEGYDVIKAMPQNGYSCKNIVDIENEAKSLVGNIKKTKNLRPATRLLIAGNEIPIQNLQFEDANEPGLVIPIKKITTDFSRYINSNTNCQVLVAGGGTSGAMAAMAAVEKGANTIVVDYFHDMGGTKTVGGVMGYYHGVKDNQFFKKQEEDAQQIAYITNTNRKMGRKLYHLFNLTSQGGEYISGSIICGAVTQNRDVNGIVICRNGVLEKVLADLTIDATGDGDVAVFAGAEYFHGDSRAGKTQNYSQWDMVGGAKQLPSATGRDYGVIDNTKLAELQRGLFISHYEAHCYDFHPMLTVRESRRIKGKYVLDFVDCVEGTHFEDFISLASSDYDPHYTGSSELTRAGFLLPHSNVLTVEIPYRSLVPEKLNRILISGRAFSQTNIALQFTRMSGDLAVLGYLTGHIAADITLNGFDTHNYSISELQKEWLALDYLDKTSYDKKPGNKSRDEEEIKNRVKNLADGKNEYLYECIKIHGELILPHLIKAFHITELIHGKLLLAKAIAWFSSNTGSELINDELKSLFDEECKTGYPNGYVENYDFIRGREKNVLEGLFWKINQNIVLLALTGYKRSYETIQHILDNTLSGGEMVERENDYYNGRIDLRIIPFYNRILNLCFYIERNPDKVFIPGLEKLLQDKNISGYKTDDYKTSRWKFYGADLELFIGSTLARCGSGTGYELLVEYLEDVNYPLKQFAVSELKKLTGKDFGYSVSDWKKHIGKLSYPQPEHRFETIKEV